MKGNEYYDKIKSHFIPGEIIKSYGCYDMVIELNIGDSKIHWSDWSVTVQAVKLINNEWVNDASLPHKRIHCTYPKRTV